jgi:hypothetical protein
MPFWRVVVEAKPDRRVRRWPAQIESAVAAVFVWARTIEEAEALAALAMEAEGFEFVTADAVKHAPAARPRREPAAVARSDIGFLTRKRADARATIKNLPNPRA